MADPAAGNGQVNSSGSKRKCRATSDGKWKDHSSREREKKMGETSAQSC
jgi:hypothetical protein